MDVAQISLQEQSYSLNRVTKKDTASAGNICQPVSIISSLSRNLERSDIDLSNSEISTNGDKVNFHLRFLKESESNLKLDGFYSEEKSSGGFSFDYVYPAEVNVNGKRAIHNFNVNFSFEFSSLNSLSVQNSEEKEDIFDFIRRITKEVFAKLNDGKTNLSGIVLNPEDLKDIANIGDKKLVQLIFHLIEMIKLAIEAKKMSHKALHGKEIIYTPHRRVNDITQIENNSGSSVSYSMSVKDTDPALTKTE